jgi:hypothetical protein
MSNHILMNTSGAMLCVNLDTTDEKGRRQALILHDRERSRPLTADEHASSEVQKLLARGDLRDVTGIDASRGAPAGRLRRPAPAAPPAAPATPPLPADDDGDTP